MTPERWKRIEEIYHAADGVPPGERAAYLDTACGGDHEIRHEVESLLREPVVEGGFAGRPALQRAAQVFLDAGPQMLLGESIGGYRVLALLGAGGMGDVYRARDARLDRDVAIKILPRAFTSDPDRLARFEREARTLAALNHPNVCGIYGVEEARGIRFLVLELVEGETLAQVLEGAAAGLPIADALAIARQIADAIEIAHDKGIVHRDLKPANIEITPTGVVKVLDFGLAKTTNPADARPAGPTQVGLILGTAAYMSPEQARGKTVDKRSDIWAFGCVLYEMLTGRGAFEGETVSDTIGRILEREPDWTALPFETPQSIRRLLRRCLAKDPKQRLRDIADVRIEIDSVNDAGAGDFDPPLATRRQRHFAWLPWTVATLLGVGLMALWVWHMRPAPPLRLMRFTIGLPPGQILNGSRGAHIVAISPDGTNVVYSGFPHGLYLRSLSDEEIKVIPGTEAYEVSEPAFSPDGKWIAFFSIEDETLKKIPLTGGAAETLCDLRMPSGIKWGPEGIVYGQWRNPDGVLLESEGGGNPRVLVRIKEGESAHAPQILPGGTHVLFTLATGQAPSRWDKAHIIVQSLRTGERTDLGEGSDARYLPTGHLIFAVSGSLYAVPFDSRTRQISGDRAQVIEGVRRASGSVTGAAALSVADNGTLIYVPGPMTPVGSAPMDLVVMDRSGAIHPLNLQPPGPYATPRVSPDGAQVAFEADDGKESVVYTYELSGTNQMQRLTSGSNNRFPSWAPDSRHVAFQSDRGGDAGVWWQALGGAAERLTTADPGTSHAPESWSGDTLLYSLTKGGNVSLWTLSLADRKVERLDSERSSAPMEATISPDGKWVAYSTTQRSQVTLYVQGFPRGPRYPLAAPSSDTPKHPRWAASGRELCYNPNVTDFHCVRINTIPLFSFGAPEHIPRNLQLSPPGTRTPYDIAPDGRFVGLIISGQHGAVGGADSRIQVVLNWFEDLKTRAPRQ